MSRRAVWTAVLVMAMAVCAAARAETFVWWEAEKADKTNFPAKSYFTPADDRERDVLSEGNWLSRDEGTKGALSAAYTVQVAKEATYTLWVRSLNGQAPFTWRFDQGDWKGPGATGRAVDRMVVTCVDDRYYGISWAKLGDVMLGAGSHTFELQIAADSGGGAAMDCFILYEGDFHPRGRCQPGQKYDRAAEGWFPFEPDRDAFGASAIDLRSLNEPEAGSQGRIIAKGEDLVFEKTGEKVRFWGVTATDSVWTMDKKDMDYLARRLAKMGVNMVRFHGAPYYETTPGRLTDGIHYLQAALKKNGIYSGFNWYCLAGAAVQPSWGLEGFKTGDRPMSLHLFYPPMQAIYKKWAANLFGSPNPYTGMSLAADPAVSFIELIDEDNYLFWTFKPETINPIALPFLERKFGDWLKAKYGSLDKALAEWGPGPKPKLPDRPEEGRLALYDAGTLSGQDWAVASRNPKRASDQLQFFIQDMRDFYSGMKKWLHDDVGYDGLVVATNWQTTDARVLGPLDFYANMAVDVTARNTYFGGPFKRTKFFPWMVGDSYQDLSLLRNPQQAITMHMQYTGHPHFITEGGWNLPNRFRAEEPLIMASYASLQGIAGMFPFELEADWDVVLSRPWPIQCASSMGQYPAAALIYRQGYVKEGPIAVNDALKLSDLYQFKGAAMSQPFSADVGRTDVAPAGASPQGELVSSFDPLCFYVGRVKQTVAEDPGKSQVLPGLTGYVDRAKKVVRSATGELTLDYGTGVLRTDAPRAQGAAGFLALAGAIQLSNVTIEMKNEYGAVILVSLDGAPLAESGRMLLQVMTEEKSYNWTTEPAKTQFSANGPEVDALRITNIGTAPLVVRKVQGSVSLKRPDAAQLKVTALDYDGYPAKAAGTAARIELDGSTLYYIIEKQEGR